MHKAGFKVLLIDKSDKQIGGDCLNEGCVPSKALIHVSRIVHQARQAKHFGISVEGIVDIKKITDYVYNSQEVIRAHENAGYYRSDGLDVALGEAKFIGTNEVEVAGKKYTAKKIVIATGSRAIKLKVPGVELVKYHDNESIFHINDLPKKLLVIGGGPIGSEIGQAFLRLGSQVTLVQQTTHLLENDHSEMAAILQQQFEKEGMHILLQGEVIRFTSPTQAEVKVRDQNQLINFDAIFVAVGRHVMIDALQVEKAGCKLENGKLVVDKFLRTTNKNVYVCGDAAGSLKFSHAAEHQARIILNNLFSPLKRN